MNENRDVSTNDNGNLMEMAKGLVNSNLINQVSSATGDDPQKVSAGFGAAIPALLHGIVQKGSTESGAESLLSMIRQSGASRASGGETAVPPPSESQGLLSQILGGQQLGVVTQLIAKTSGLESRSVMSILGALAPALLGALSGKASASGFSPSWLMGFLSQQKGSIAGAAPAGLGSLAGLGGSESSGGGIAGFAGKLKDVVTGKKGGERELPQF